MVTRTEDALMAKHKHQPSSLAIWLGVADNSFTRQKTVKFGDASAVNSGRLWSIVTVVVLILAWWVATVGGILDPIFWPPLDGSLYPWDDPNRARPGVVDRFVSLVVEGYRNVSLGEHVWTSVRRVLLGVLFGAVVGIPLGFAMGLNSVARGLLDPVVEFIRPIPPLALIPLVILWLGIDETAKTFPALPCRALHHADRGAGRSQLGSDLEGPCRLLTGGLSEPGPSPRDPPQRVAGDLHRPSNLHGGLLGDAGGRGARGRGPGSRLDDDGRQELPPDRRGGDRNHHHRRDRLCH